MSIFVVFVLAPPGVEPVFSVSVAIVLFPDLSYLFVS